MSVTDRGKLGEKSGDVIIIARFALLEELEALSLLAWMAARCGGRRRGFRGGSEGAEDECYWMEGEGGHREVGGMRECQW